jgi:hypothetical protein
LGQPAGNRVAVPQRADRGNVRGEIQVSKHREVAYALLRQTLGIVFLFAGIGKFKAWTGNFGGGMLQQFSGKLPMLDKIKWANVLVTLERKCDSHRGISHVVLTDYRFKDSASKITLLNYARNP